jgi:hypothetical protein
MIHDQFTDKSFRVFAAKVRDFGDEAKEMLKTAEVDYDEADTLPESAFAWPERRLFPVNTPEATTLSQIYAHGETLPAYVQANLEKAAELYGVTLQVTEKVAAEVTEDPSDYLVPQLRFGRITAKEHVKEAAEFFSNNYKKMDIETRAHAAATLIKKASAFGEKLPVTFYKHAGLTQTNPRVLGEWLEVRAGLASDQTAKGGYEKLAAYVQDKKQFKVAGRSDLLKIADTIGILDERAGLQGRYDLTLPDPLLTVFNTTKTAGSTVRLGGKDVELSQLMNMNPQDYGDVLGEDIVAEITDSKGLLKEAELLDILKTLPADLQCTLVQNLGL